MTVQNDPNDFSPGMPLDPLAQGMIRHYSRTFAERLLIEAALVAREQRASIIRPEHVVVARQRIGHDPEITGGREFMILAGGALMGAFVQGFTDAALTGDVRGMVVYAVQGTIGFVIAVRALSR